MRAGVVALKHIVRTVATLFVGAFALAAARLATPQVDASVPPAPVRLEATGWFHPEWFPDSADLDAVSAMDADGPRKGPSLRSRSAFVYDIDAGVVLFEKNADVVRPVASITKLVSS